MGMESTLRGWITYMATGLLLDFFVRILSTTFALDYFIHTN
jgi:hypothetical protein